MFQLNINRLTLFIKRLDYPFRRSISGKTQNDAKLRFDSFKWKIYLTRNRAVNRSNVRLNVTSRLQPYDIIWQFSDKITSTVDVSQSLELQRANWYGYERLTESSHSAELQTIIATAAYAAFSIFSLSTFENACGKLFFSGFLVNKCEKRAKICARAIIRMK